MDTEVARLRAELAEAKREVEEAKAQRRGAWKSGRDRERDNASDYLYGLPGHWVVELADGLCLYMEVRAAIAGALPPRAKENGDG